MVQIQDMNQALLESVEHLPPLPQTVRNLQLYIDEAGSNMKIDRVAEIISGDPLVTAKLLQLANSPFYGFSREITTIQQVVNLLGVTNIKNIVTADSIKGNFKVDMSPYGLDTNKFLQNCNEEAKFVSSWLLEEDKKLSYLLVPCVMLLRFGMIVFANFLIQNHKEKEFYNALKQNDFHNIVMVEDNFLGVDHISFLGFLLHRWDFDEALIESVCFANTPHSADGEIKRSAYALAIANNIFAPYNGGSPYRVNAALNLIKEAKSQGANFNTEHFIAKLPDFAKANLNKPID
ncbi:HDOD domain-containing protein [Campylobacter sp. MIT 97-5078]|uniref:HDOD domain-containing protein n=1 Tax=Campylobacter sp. MIT 97-5078 TaxID=1548153 RepID=UPI000512D2FB|nr:HDOD domain-containing protein [Campylobacter sp. MIT 97-5078]KGI55474.1 hypothetical protein LR59_11945 [Campylobacter sp. MIT 97-5078]TQR27045.1 HDOD domain-containing protein [Campylobacter sp. MIT 97-5078]